MKVHQNKFEEIKEELDVYGVGIADSESLKNKCLDICGTYNLSGEQLAVHWLSYAASNGHEEISLENLEHFEKSLVKQKRGQGKSNESNSSLDSSSKLESGTLFSTDDDLLATYNASPISIKNAEEVSSYVRPSVKRSFSLSQSFEETSRSLAPSLSQSPLGHSQKKYSERSNAGTVVAHMGLGLGQTEWITKASSECEIKQLECVKEHSLVSSYRFMFEKLRDCAEVMDDAIYDFGQRLLESSKVDEFSPLRISTNVCVWCVGKICCDSVGRLNAASVMLQGDREFSSGDVVRLDLSSLTNYSIFPGQIVAVKGINTTGDCFVAKEIISGTVLPPPLSITTKSEGDIQIQIACGPFTTLDNLLYEPLMDLLELVVENRPQVLFLLGPLLDAAHPSLEDPMLADSYDSIISRVLDKVEAALISSPTKVYVVANHRDICSTPVYPTPPVLSPSVKTPSSIKLLPDPCLLDINSVAVGITTVDYLMHVSREEINYMFKTSDRLTRLSEHMLMQQSFYPIYPPPEGFPLNLQKAELYARLPFTPHLMVTPSDLRGFIKRVGDCVFLNPERLAKGKSGGCFCRLNVTPQGANPPDVKVQIVKI